RAGIKYRPPATIKKDDPNILLAKRIRAGYPTDRLIVFTIDGLDLYLAGYMTGHPQIHPCIEYYAGNRPVLCFGRSQDLVRDLLYINSHNRYATCPLIVSRNRAAISEVYRSLEVQGYLRGRTVTLERVMDRFLMVITPSSLVP